MYAILKLPITAPQAPALGAVVIVGSAALSVPLDRPSTGPTTLASYTLERSTDGSSWTEVATGIAIFGESRIYADTGLTESTAYTYRCRSVDTTGRYSQYSGAVTATTPATTGADAPISVAVVQSGSGLQISWAPGTSGADSYTLYRKGSSESSYWPRSMGTATTFLDTGMGAATTWSYYVTATVSGNESLPSTIVTGTTASGSGGLKWYPGHYAVPNAVFLPSSVSAHTTLWNQIAPVANFVGGSMFIPWGQLEPTTAGVYSWTALDNEIAKLAAAGKKTMINVWAHRYGTTSPGTEYFPAYLVASSDVIGVDDGAGTRVVEAALWRSDVMDRYMALFAAIAARYDNDDRVSVVKGCETAFVDAGGDFSGTALRDEFIRLAEYLPTVFARTPTSMEANFLQTQTQMPDLMQACVDSGVGMGGPDMFPVEFSGLADNWGQRSLRGERYSGGAWVAGVAANQQAAIPVMMEQQVVRSTSATPALYYNSAVTRYSATHVTWTATTTAFLYGSGGATLVPAMNWSNVLAYVRDNALPLRTSIPTALA